MLPPLPPPPPPPPFLPPVCRHSQTKSATCLPIQLQLSCIQDSQSYTKTLAALQDVEPDEILLHDGTRGRVLASKIVGAFHGDRSRVLFVSRQYFDQDKVYLLSG